jgi:hypothetical protein
MAARQQERRAILRIDAQPVGKKFQGVWLELVDGTKWIVDYRARELWTWFRDREVIVSGGCYEPVGEAIRATHFRIDRLRDARPERGTRPYLAMGPEVLLRGQLELVTAPPGSKAAGTTRSVFRADDGVTYNVLGDVPADKPVRVRGRALEPDLSYVARTGDRDLWISEILDADHEDAPAPPEIPCP